MIGTTVVDDDDMIVEYVTGQVVVVTVWIEGCGLAKFGSCKGDGTPGWILAIGRKFGSTYGYRCCIYRYRRCLRWDSLGCGNSRGDSCDRGARDRYYGCVGSACCQSFGDRNCDCRGCTRVGSQGHRASCCFCGLQKISDRDRLAMQWPTHYRQGRVGRYCDRDNGCISSACCQGFRDRDCDC